MVSEFDLPCTACGTDLRRRTTSHESGRQITVAECPACGTRHYPESALDALKFRT